MQRLIKKAIHILLVFAFINSAFFVPQFNNADTFQSERNALNEPDGELGSILGEILVYCFNIDISNTLNQNEEFVEKDLTIKRIASIIIYLQLAPLNNVILSLIKTGASAMPVTNDNSVNALKAFSFLALLYLH